MMLMTSCKDDEQLTSLTGTNWEYSVSASGVSMKMNFNFKTATAYEFTADIMGEKVTDTGTYVFDSEKSTITFDKGTEFEETVDVKDNKFSISFDDLDQKIVFTKK